MSKLLAYHEGYALQYVTDNYPHLWDDIRSVHVSLIIRRGVVVSAGVNQRKTHPLAKRIGYRHSDRHSELDALLNMRVRDGSGHALLNYRFNRRGQPLNAQPCRLCASWVYDEFDMVLF